MTLTIRVSIANLRKLGCFGTAGHTVGVVTNNNYRYQTSQLFDFREFLESDASKLL